MLAPQVRRAGAVLSHHVPHGTLLQPLLAPLRQRPQLAQRPGLLDRSASLVRAQKQGEQAVLSSWDSSDERQEVEVLQPPEEGGQLLSPRARGLLALNALVIICATNWSLLKYEFGKVDATTFLAARFFLGSLAFTPFLVDAVKQEGLVRKGAELGFWMWLGYAFQTAGLLTTPASRASFISAFTVIVVPILAGFVSKKEISPVTWLCAFLSFVGVGLLEQGGDVRLNIGDLYSLLSAVAFGIQIYRTEMVCRQSKRSQMMALTAVALATTALGGGAMLAFAHHDEALAFLQNPGPKIVQAAASLPLWPLLYTSLFSTDAVLYLEMAALQDVSSVDAAITYSLEPLLGAGLANWLLGERWTAIGWVGAGLILSASLTSQLGTVFTAPLLTIPRLAQPKKWWERIFKKRQ